MATTSALSSPRGRSAVRVGVRVRPLASQELSQEGGNEAVVTCHGSREVRLGDRRFTYDSVFNQQTEQDELYASVAPPLLEGVLEGYNATVRCLLGFTWLYFRCFFFKSHTCFPFNRLWHTVKQDLEKHTRWVLRRTRTLLCWTTQGSFLDS